MSNWVQEHLAMVITLTSLAVSGLVGFAGFAIWGDERLENIEKIPAIEQSLQDVAGAVQQLQKNSLFQRWIWLNNKRRAVGLTPQEHSEWCGLGIQIKTMSSCPNYRAGPQG